MSYEYIILLLDAYDVCSLHLGERPEKKKWQFENSSMIDENTQLLLGVIPLPHVYKNVNKDAFLIQVKLK